MAALILPIPPAVGQSTTEPTADVYAIALDRVQCVGKLLKGLEKLLDILALTERQGRHRPGRKMPAHFQSTDQSAGVDGALTFLDSE